MHNRHAVLSKADGGFKKTSKNAVRSEAEARKGRSGGERERDL
jgi:hypothetical protein